MVVMVVVVVVMVVVVVVPIEMVFATSYTHFESFPEDC